MLPALHSANSAREDLVVADAELCAELAGTPAAARCTWTASVTVGGVPYAVLGTAAALHMVAVPHAATATCVPAPVD